MSDLPFRAEYAKSGRSSCKICKASIEKGSLRMAVMIQSPRFDGKVPFWHHYDCFFMKKKVTTVGDIGFFETLRWEDQEKIKKKIAEGANGTTSSGKKKKSGSIVDRNLLEFSVEYAKSSKSSCRHCDEKISKKEVRVSKMEHDSETAMRFGPVPGWHHLECFAKIRDDLGFTETGDKLPGFSQLEEEDQELVKSKIKAVGGTKKRKAEPEPELEVPAKKKNAEKIEKAEEKALKAQSKLVYSFRDKIEKAMKRKDLTYLLESNQQEPPTGDFLMMDALSDCLAFGALKPCPECNGQLRLSNNTYKCSGYVTGWTKCEYVTQKPERKAFKIPDEMKEEFNFLKEYKYVKRERIFPSNPVLPTEISSASGGSFKPLNKFKIAIVGNLKCKKSDAEALILKLGGKVMKKLNDSVNFVIASKDSTPNMDKHKGVKSNSIYVVSEEILDDLENIYSEGMLPTVMKKHELFSWGKEPEEAVPAVIRKKSEISGSSAVQKVKVYADGKAAVDPMSGLEDTHHVVEKGKDVYNAVLGKVDILKGRNSYYKIQLLKSNARNLYTVFRAWGRVGTTIGDKKIEKFPTFEEALESFKCVYQDVTKGNHWDDRDNFVKQPSGYYPLDIDYGHDDSKKIQDLKPCSDSKLDMPIQELITMIFDIEAMKKAMLEFEIDLKKMPLGKLSKKQIQSAYLVLTEVQNLLKGEKNSTKILDASNRFYTLIPHDFGMRKPPLLDNDKLLQSKIEMLNSLLEIELAYNLLLEKSTDDNPIDQHYEQLKTDIEVLDKKTDEYKRIETYLQNTHAPTHTQYKLKLEEVFKVSRQGESERYQKFKDLHNKKLLWHGSRTTNFAGILSQGLRIAPPEAPSTGYMFGKGIYFADMVSKSANYCYTSRANPKGLLLLCEVALGNMLERFDSDYITRLSKESHSTKGIGQTQPDPKDTVIENGVEIPLGKPITGNAKARSLLYNEYIVYDINQVNIKYLLKVKFNYGR